MAQLASSFTVVNDRVVLDNGITKRWRCAVCAWWRVWQVKSCSGLRNSSGHQHGQAPGAEIERVIFYSKRALRRQPPSWLRRIEVILTDIRNDPLRAQRHARSTVSRQRQHK